MPKPIQLKTVIKILEKMDLFLYPKKVRIENFVKMK